MKLLGAAPFYWALRATGAAPDTAFQLGTIFLSAAYFAAAWFLFRRGAALGPAAACAGAFLVALTTAAAGALALAPLAARYLRAAAEVGYRS